jgi:hypothetical protein
MTVYSEQGLPTVFLPWEGFMVGWLVGLYLLLPLGAQDIRETLRFTSFS